MGGHFREGTSKQTSEWRRWCGILLHFSLWTKPLTDSGLPFQGCLCGTEPWNTEVVSPLQAKGGSASQGIIITVSPSRTRVGEVCLQPSCSVRGFQILASTTPPHWHRASLDNWSRRRPLVIRSTSKTMISVSAHGCHLDEMKIKGVLKQEPQK